MIAVLVALVAALFFGGMSVFIRIGLARNPDVGGEPASAPLLVGAALIVAGGFELARDRDRPEHLRKIGLLYAFVAVVLFSSRDNLIRWLSRSTTAPPAAAAVAALLGGFICALVDVGPTLRRSTAGFPPFVPAGLCFGLSYLATFEAYYRGRVTVVSPLIATEALFGVALVALLVRRTELVVVGALIGAFR